MFWLQWPHWVYRGHAQRLLGYPPKQTPPCGAWLMSPQPRNHQTSCKRDVASTEAGQKSFHTYRLLAYHPPSHLKRIAASLSSHPTRRIFPVRVKMINQGSMRTRSRHGDQSLLPPSDASQRPLFKKHCSKVTTKLGPTCFRPSHLNLSV